MANDLALILKSPVEELIPKMIAWNNTELRGGQCGGESAGRSGKGSGVRGQAGRHVPQHTRTAEGNQGKERAWNQAHEEGACHLDAVW